MRDYIFTDLACEREDLIGNTVILNDRISMHITPLSEEENSKVNGRYVSFSSPKVWELTFDDSYVLSRSVAEELRTMIQEVSEGDHRASVMVVGLGNAELTPDSLGPETVKNITVTRHLYQKGNTAHTRGIGCEVSAVTTGVLASTGIETVELIKGAVSRVKPDLVIAVDSLAARSPERLASTIQISNRGIAPGSGIGNHQKAIREETIGIPVIAIGIPTVIHSTTLIRDVLEENKILRDTKELRTILQKCDGFFATPKETDLLIKSAAILLADAIDLACTIRE